MSDGKTHAAITIGASVVVAGTMFGTGFTAEEVRLATTGCLTGVILGPDLDVDGGFLGHGIVDKYLGRIVGKIWRIIWWPYAKLMPHRSTWSHAPVISTLVRLAYCYLFYFLAVSGVGKSPWIPPLHTVYYFTFGLVVSDTLHYIADIISTYLKRRRNARLPVSVRRMQERRRAIARFQQTTPAKTPRMRR